MIPNTNTELRLIAMNGTRNVAHKIAAWAFDGSPLIVGAYTLEVAPTPYFISDRSRLATKDEVSEGMHHLRVFRETDQ